MHQILSGRVVSSGCAAGMFEPVDIRLSGRALCYCGLMSNCIGSLVWYESLGGGGRLSQIVAA